MGLMDRFGRIADTYISERDALVEAEQERRRVFAGHSFWPTEVLRDTIIFASMIMVICFYSWIVPPPLHRLDSYSPIGMFYFHMDTSDGENICPNIRYLQGLSEISLVNHTFIGMLHGGVLRLQEYQ